MVATGATVATAPLPAGAEELKSSWPAKDLTNDWDLCIQISSIFPSWRFYNQFHMFRDVPESGIRDVVLGLGKISGYAGLMFFFF